MSALAVGRLSSMRSETKAIPLGLVLLFASLPLFGWWMTGLFDVDEGFYGAVVAEMNRRHEWITPFFNGHPWFEKPILLYWLAKPCMMLLGPDFGPRLPSVLCTIALFVVCGFFMKRRYGASAQSLTIFCLGSSILVLALGRLMMTDAPLNLALTTAFLSFYESLVGDRRWRILTAFCLGLGVLAKGPVALILFVLVAGIALWRDVALREQVRGYWLAGTAVLFATIAVWYVPCYLANGRVFVDEFLVKQNVGRFLGGDQAHSLGLAGLPFYIPFVFIAVCPWGWVEWRAFSKENVDDPFSRYLFVWAAVIFGFFTISSAKLPHYILPMIAPMAMLAAKRIATKPRLNWTAVGVACISIFLLLGVIDPLLRIWYVVSGQREAQALVRKHPEIEVLYQLGRREKELNTGTTKLQETALPSLIMYLNHSVIETDDPAGLVEQGQTISKVLGRHDGTTDVDMITKVRSRVFFTRKSRMENLKTVLLYAVIEETDHFGIYRLVDPGINSPDMNPDDKEIGTLLQKHSAVEAIYKTSNYRFIPVPKNRRLSIIQAETTDQLFNREPDGEASSHGEGLFVDRGLIFISRKTDLPADRHNLETIEESKNFGVYRFRFK